jgi:hypothetical protein
VDDAQSPGQGQWQTFRDAILVGMDARLTALAGLAALEREHGMTSATADERARRLAAGEAARLHWNATTVVYLYGVIEGHITAMLPTLHDAARHSREGRRKAFISSLRDQDRKLRAEGTPVEKIRALRAFSTDLIDHLLPEPVKTIPKQQLTAERWERALSGIFFGPVPGRPLPDDLRATLNEIGEIRNVLLHRLGITDERVLNANFEGPWRAVGERVVIEAELYRRYVAALYAYTEELRDRLLVRLGAAPVSDVTRWREAVPAGG